MGANPTPRSFPHWANGRSLPGFGLRCGIKLPHRSPKTWCPFGDIRRSGCSPAEPYPADDTGSSSRPAALAMIIPATIQNRSLPVISTPSFPSKSVTNVIGLTLTHVPVRTPSGCRCGKSGQVLRFNNSDSSPNTNLLGRCLAAVASPRYHPRRSAFVAFYRSSHYRAPHALPTTRRMPDSHALHRQARRRGVSSKPVLLK